MSSVSTSYAPGPRSVQAARGKISDATTDHLKDQDCKCSSSLISSLLDLILQYHGLLALISLITSALLDSQLFWSDRRTSVADPLASNSAFDSPVNSCATTVPLKPSAYTAESTKCLPCDNIFTPLISMATGLPYLRYRQWNHAQRSRTVPTDLTSTKVAPGISAIDSEAQRTEHGHFCFQVAQLTAALADDSTHDGSDSDWAGHPDF
jgi:hypothetical protein